MANSFSARHYCLEHLDRLEDIEARVRGCPEVASLKSVNDALTKLTFNPTSTVTEIAEVIGKDLSLTARLLRLVNSVFAGLSVRVTSLEEAIFFLGLRQIRQMAMTTRVLEEMDAFIDKDIEVSSEAFWRHCIATAIMTREVLTMANGIKDDDQYYIAGLLSDTGKLVMLHSFTDELKASLDFDASSPREHLEMERAEFGFTHADLGALYLEQHNMGPDIVETVLFHHEPEKAARAQIYASGVEMADYFARYAGCQPGFEAQATIEYGSWESMHGWKHLFSSDRSGSQYARASVLRSIDNLPSLLHGLLD